MRVWDALGHYTTPHNLVCTVLAPAFLLPGEPEPVAITTANLEALGATLEWDEGAGHLYLSLSDDPAEADYTVPQGGLRSGLAVKANSGSSTPGHGVAARTGVG